MMPLLGELRLIDGEYHVWCGQGWIAERYSDYVHWPVQMEDNTAGDGVSLVSIAHPSKLAIIPIEINQAALEIAEIDIDVPLYERIAIMIAEGNNGGTWAEHYTREQKDVWRMRACEIINLIRDNP